MAREGRLRSAGWIGRVRNSEGNETAVTSLERWGLLAIVLGGVAFRLIGLGHLSFAGDEETTTLAALALMKGWPPTLPGGLVYVRGLPFTALEAISIALWGVSEASLRLFPALLAGPRILATWWLARPFLGPRFALLAALLLGFAPLDVEQSRNARMYSLFATFDLLALAAVIHTALGSKRARTAIACGIGAVATHIVAVTHAVIPVSRRSGAGGRVLRARVPCCLPSGGSAGVGFLFFKKLSKWAYSMGEIVEGAATPKAGPIAEHSSSPRRPTG